MKIETAEALVDALAESGEAEVIENYRGSRGHWRPTAAVSCKSEAHFVAGVARLAFDLGTESEDGEIMDELRGEEFLVDQVGMGRTFVY